MTLEIQGKKFDSEGFAAEMAKLEERSRGELCFVIGGSLGLSKEVSARAALHLSFSDFTFPHQLMRVLFFGTTVSELPHKNRSTLSQIACVTGINLIY